MFLSTLESNGMSVPSTYQHTAFETRRGTSLGINVHHTTALTTRDFRRSFQIQGGLLMRLWGRLGWGASHRTASRDQKKKAGAPYSALTRLLRKSSCLTGGGRCSSISKKRARRRSATGNSIFGTSMGEECRSFDSHVGVIGQIDRLPTGRQRDGVYGYNVATTSSCYYFTIIIDCR